jgi:predicted amidohydrolase YtcJ
VQPEQRVGRLDALSIATNGGAHLTFEENRRGRLKMGWDADLAMLSDDPLAVATSRIPAIEAVMTMTAGRVVHDIT